MTSKLKARISAIIAGFVFFGIYFLTQNKGFFPGEAARQAAIALRTERGESFAQFRQIEEHTSRALNGNTKATSLEVKDTVVPYRTKYTLWHLAGQVAAAIPFGSTSRRFNTLSAICGGISALLAFALCRGILLLLSFHTSPLSAPRRKVAAYIAGVVGVLALGMSVPFWISSTRFLPHSFEIMLLLLTGWALYSATVHHSVGWLFAFGILFGMSVFETETGVYLLPVWIFFIVRSMLVGSLSDARGWASLLVGLAVGIIIYFLLCQVLMAREDVSLLLPLKEMLISTTNFRKLLLGGNMFEDQSRLVCLCFAIIPFIAAVSMSIWGDSENANSSGGFLLFVLSCTVAISCSTIQISPWGAYSDTDGALLPTTIYLMNAYIASYLAGQGVLMAGGRVISPSTKRRRRRAEVDDDGNVRSEEHKDYPVGRLLALFMLALVLLSGLWNFRIVSDWADPLTDLFAGKLVEKSAPCTWYCSPDGEVDSHLRIHSRLANRPLSVICETDVDDSIAKLSRAISRDPTFADLQLSELRGALLSTNTDHFFTTWISADTNIANKLAFGTPNVFIDNNRKIVPAIACYRTVADDIQVDWEALAREHLAFWDEIRAVPPLGRNAPHWLRQRRAALRKNMYDIGKMLATILAENSKGDVTRQVMEKVELIREEPTFVEKTYSPYDMY